MTSSATGRTVSSSDGRRVLAVILAAQGLRGVGYGLAAVQLGALLRGRGLDAGGVGLVLAAIVAGTAAASLALGRWGDRLGRARAYGLLYAALALGGVALAAGAPVWLLALVALSGALSVEVVESGPFTTLEQVMLASTGAPQASVVRGFGVYNAVATLAGAAGALLGSLPPDQRLLGGTLLIVGVAGVLLATRLPRSVEAPPRAGHCRPGRQGGCCPPSSGVFAARGGATGGAVCRRQPRRRAGRPGLDRLVARRPLRRADPRDRRGVRRHRGAAGRLVPGRSPDRAPRGAACDDGVPPTYRPTCYWRPCRWRQACRWRSGCCWRGPACRRWTCRPARHM